MYINRKPRALALLSRDLLAEGFGFVSLSPEGELLVLNGNSVERYQARPIGSGVNNSMWGMHEGGFEFCGSTQLEDM